jgi:hypothetical protein
MEREKWMEREGHGQFENDLCEWIVGLSEENCRTADAQRDDLSNAIWAWCPECAETYPDMHCCRRLLHQERDILPQAKDVRTLLERWWPALTALADLTLQGFADGEVTELQAKQMEEAIAPLITACGSIDDLTAFAQRCEEARNRWTVRRCPGGYRAGED